jgi:replication fork protection complex subunit Csm3/Swi3
MPSAISPNPRAGSAAPGDVDNPFNYDDAIEDFLKDIPLDKGDSQMNKNAQQEPPKDIDEEITVKKKRKPVPKLDENRLLSDPGIPRLRKIARTQLKFRGKGHEFSDISRLLNTYQLWLDDLFPRAKFKDALGDVEKVGHSKRMQVMRRAWLDATKPQQRDATPEKDGDFVMNGALPIDGINRDQASTPEEGNEVTPIDSLHPKGDQNSSLRNGRSTDAPDDDELDALLAGDNNSGHVATGQGLQHTKGPFEEDWEDEDELDALLAAEPTATAGITSSGGSARVNGASESRGLFEDDFADEEEAMDML